MFDIVFHIFDRREGCFADYESEFTLAAIPRVGDELLFHCPDGTEPSLWCVVANVMWSMNPDKDNPLSIYVTADVTNSD